LYIIPLATPDIFAHIFDAKTTPFPFILSVPSVPPKPQPIPAPNPAGALTVPPLMLIVPPFPYLPPPIPAP